MIWDRLNWEGKQFICGRTWRLISSTFIHSPFHYSPWVMPFTLEVPGTPSNYSSDLQTFICGLCLFSGVPSHMSHFLLRKPLPCPSGTSKWIYPTSNLLSSAAILFLYALFLFPFHSPNLKPGVALTPSFSVLHTSSFNKSFYFYFPHISSVHPLRCLPVAVRGSNDCPNWSAF